MATAAGSFVLSERYARALLDVALDKSADPEAILKDLEAFSALLDRQADLANVLSTPTFPPEKRLAVLDAVLDGKPLNPASVNLLRLLTERERMPLLGLVARQYQRLLLEHQKVQHGAVTSARAISEDQKTRLAERLGAALGKKMVLTYETDESLVGGVVVRIENRVYDASIITQLQRFKEQALSSL